MTKKQIIDLWNSLDDDTEIEFPYVYSKNLNAMMRLKINEETMKEEQRTNIEVRMANIEIPFGAKDSELMGFEYNISEGYEAEIKDGKVIIRKVDSEDEKIRKWLINKINEETGVYPWPKWKDKVTAWIEKQGEKDILEDAIVDSNTDGLIADTIKQGEQKPVECMYSEDNYTDEDRKTLCDGCQEECKFKPVEWSEEDELMLSSFFNCIGHYYADNFITKEQQTLMEDWLKSFKDRCIPQPKSEWDEIDGKILDSIIKDVMTLHNSKTIDGLKCKVNWLKSLKDRVIQQPKQEWSEEDKRIYSSITYSFAHNFPLTIQQQEFVKSIKERYTWKPSNEQMQQLKWIAEQNEHNLIGKELMTLYTDLKTL